MREKRKQQRKLVGVPMGWSLYEGVFVPAICRDISLGGCFLDGPSPAPVGTSVIVHLALPGLVDELGRAVAAGVDSMVRWTTSQGMGVQFGLMGGRETAALVRWLDRLPPQPGDRAPSSGRRPGAWTPR